MLIRDVTDADFATIAAITNHYIVNTPIHFAYDKVTPGELRLGWSKGIWVYPYLVLIDDEGGRSELIG